MNILNSHDGEYHNLLRNIIHNGRGKNDRTGTGTISLFGAQCRFDLRKSFPLLTTKKVFFKGIAVELLWLLRGETNIGYMLDHNVHIWDEWTPAYKNGGKEGVQRAYEENSRHEDLNLGPVYGEQWRNFGGFTYIDEDINFTNAGVDQIQKVIERIKEKPDCRRLIVSAWNPIEVPKMALPPCHTLFQFHVNADNELSCQLYQRSADVFLGVPFNIASYALLTHMVAQVCGLKVGDFVHTFGDVHIYSNHIEQVKEQLSRDSYPTPEISLNKDVKNIFDFKLEDFEIKNYQSHPAIKADVAV